MPKQPQWLADFGRCWQGLSDNDLNGIDQLYHGDVHFEDPSGTIQGREHLKRHLSVLYQVSEDISYQLDTAIIQDENCASQPWKLSFRHPKLNGGNTVTVEGISVLRAESGKIIYHRDYFDLGQMLYEGIPMLGAIVRRIKQRVAP